jgi:hypothetical protein
MLLLVKTEHTDFGHGARWWRTCVITLVKASSLHSSSALRLLQVTPRSESSGLDDGSGCRSLSWGIVFGAGTDWRGLEVERCGFLSC